MHKNKGEGKRLKERERGGEREREQERERERDLIGGSSDFLLPGHFPFQNDKFIFIVLLLK